MGAGSQGFGPSSTAFLGHKQGAGWEVEQLGHEPVPVWDAGTLGVTAQHQFMEPVFLFFLF